MIPLRHLLGDQVHQVLSCLLHSGTWHVQVPEGGGDQDAIDGVGDGDGVGVTPDEVGALAWAASEFVDN